MEYLDFQWINLEVTHISKGNMGMGLFCVVYYAICPGVCAYGQFDI